MSSRAEEVPVLAAKVGSSESDKFTRYLSDVASVGAFKVRPKKEAR